MNFKEHTAKMYIKYRAWCNSKHWVWNSTAIRIRILDKYIFTAIAIPFVYCIVLFLFFFIVYDLTVNFEDYFKSDVVLRQLFEYYLYSIPSIVVNMTPVATLLSLLYAIGIFSRYNEFIAMRSSGISYTRMIMPFFVFGCFVVSIVFFLNETIVPDYTRKVSVIFHDEIQNDALECTQISFYNRYAMRDWIGYLSRKNNTLKKVQVRQFASDGKIIQKLFAQNAQWLDRNWWFFNGRIFNFDEQNYVHVMAFKKIHMPYREDPEDFFQSQEQSMYMNYRQLKRHMKVHPFGSKAYKEKLVDLHFRIAFPFISLVAVIFGIPIGLLSSRGGMLYGVGLSFGICLLFYVVTTVCIIMGKEGLLSPFISAWCANGLFSISGIVMLCRLR